MKSQRNGHRSYRNPGNLITHSFPHPIYCVSVHKRSSARVKGEPENARRQHFKQLQITFPLGTSLWRRSLPSSEHPQSGAMAAALTSQILLPLVRILRVSLSLTPPLTGERTHP